MDVVKHNFPWSYESITMTLRWPLANLWLTPSDPILTPGDTCLTPGWPPGDPWLTLWWPLAGPLMTPGWPPGESLLTPWWHLPDPLVTPGWPPSDPLLTPGDTRLTLWWPLLAPWWLSTDPLVVCPNNSRSQEALLLIQKHVAYGTTIIADKYF